MNDVIHQIQGSVRAARLFAGLAVGLCALWPSLIHAEPAAPPLSAETEADADMDAADLVVARYLAGDDKNECAGAGQLPCEDACLAGHLDVCQRLAQAVELSGRKRSLGRAAALYRLACNGGLLVSCTNLGKMLALGKGVPRDEPGAIAILGPTCDRGNAAACHQLGNLYAWPLDAPRDAWLGFWLYFRACELGDAYSCWTVSLSYKAGTGIAEDAGKAFEFAGRACTGAFSYACGDVGRAKMTGVGTSQDIPGAIVLLEKLCDEQPGAGCDSLAELYGGLVPGAPFDLTRARHYAERACDGWSERGCTIYNLLRRPGDPELTAGMAGHSASRGTE